LLCELDLEPHVPVRVEKQPPAHVHAKTDRQTDRHIRRRVDRCFVCVNLRSLERVPMRVRAKSTPSRVVVRNGWTERQTDRQTVTMRVCKRATTTHSDGQKIAPPVSRRNKHHTCRWRTRRAAHPRQAGRGSSHGVVPGRQPMDTIVTHDG